MESLLTHPKQASFKNSGLRRSYIIGPLLLSAMGGFRQPISNIDGLLILSTPTDLRNILLESRGSCIFSGLPSFKFAAIFYNPSCC